MIVSTLLLAAGLKFVGFVDISWATLVLIFVVWLQRGKDWTDIDNAIRSTNSRIDEVDKEYEIIKENLSKVEERISILERPEKIFLDIEERIGRGEEYTEEDVSFLFKETRDVARRNEIIKIHSKYKEEQKAKDKAIQEELDLEMEKLINE